MADRKSQIAGTPRGSQAGPRREVICPIIPLFQYPSIPSFHRPILVLFHCRTPSPAPEGRLCKTNPIFTAPRAPNKANFAGPSARNKPNLPWAASAITVVQKRGYDARHRLHRRENKANPRVPHRAKKSQFARCGSEWSSTNRRCRMRLAEVGRAKQSQFRGVYLRPIVPAFQYSIIPIPGPGVARGRRRRMCLFLEGPAW